MSFNRKNRVFIGGITEDIRKDEIEKEFSKFGKLNSVWVAQNPPGFAFVEYDDERDAEECVRAMNGMSIPGTTAKLRVELSKTRGRTGGGRGGGGRGGFGGRGGGFGNRDGGFSGRGGRDFGGRGGGFRGRGGGGRGGPPFNSRGGGGGRDRPGGRSFDRGGERSFSGSGGGSYDKGGSGYQSYRSGPRERSPLQGGRRTFGGGGRDFSPNSNSYSSGGYMQGNSGY